MKISFQLIESEVDSMPLIYQLPTLLFLNVKQRFNCNNPVQLNAHFIIARTSTFAECKPLNIHNRDLCYIDKQ